MSGIFRATSRSARARKWWSNSPGRAAPQQLADLTVGHARLVALLKRDVEDEHPLVVGVAPARPVLEEADVALDVLPVVTGQVGVAHAQFRAAEPAAELLHPLHAAGVGGQEGAERRHALRGCGGGHGRRPRLRQVGGSSGTDTAGTSMSGVGKADAAGSAPGAGRAPEPGVGWAAGVGRPVGPGSAAPVPSMGAAPAAGPAARAADTATAAAPTARARARTRLCCGAIGCSSSRSRPPAA